MSESTVCPKFSDLVFIDYAYSRDYAVTVVGEPVRGLFRRFSNLILGRGWKPYQVVTHTSAGKIASAILRNGYGLQCITLAKPDVMMLFGPYARCAMNVEGFSKSIFCITPFSKTPFFLMPAICTEQVPLGGALLAFEEGLSEKVCPKGADMDALKAKDIDKVLANLAALPPSRFAHAPLAPSVARGLTIQLLG